MTSSVMCSFDLQCMVYSVSDIEILSPKGFEVMILTFLDYMSLIM